MSNKSASQKARDSLASILSYYRHNRESLENVPDWVDRAESEEVLIGFKMDTVPSDEQNEEYKAELKALLATEELKKEVPAAILKSMTDAAEASKARRKGGS